MGKINEFLNNITEDNVEEVCTWAILFGIVAAIYSIVAGIWGFAPIERMNVKIFGTACIIICIFGIVLAAIQDDKKKKK
jgi:quinol-cytochrome oxidoreductase complex cytochrome b subunit